MTSQGSDGGPSDVCPSCNTRLRISLQGLSRYEFGCPECGLALLARRVSDNAVEILPVSAIPLTRSHEQSGVKLSPGLQRGKSRMVAAMITAVIGLILFILTTASTQQSQQTTDLTTSNLTIRHPAVDNASIGESVDSTGPGIGDNRPATDAGLSERTASSPHNNDSDESANMTTSAEPNARRVTPQETAPRLIELPFNLANSSTRDLQPKRPAVSTQQVAGTEDSTDPRSQEAATIGQRPSGNDVPNLSAPKVPAQSVTKPMDVRSRLAISIRRFRQTKPVPLRDMIRTIETMSRVRVDVSTVPSELLAAEVTISLRETTPLEILAAAGRKHGLRAIVGDSTVQLISNPK
jgi:hypothetical protein